MAKIHVRVFDINTNELIDTFDSCISASKYLSRYANERYGLNIRVSTFSSRIISIKDKTDDGKMDFPYIGLKLWRSFPCSKCRSGQYFDGKNKVCDKCVEWQKKLDRDREFHEKCSWFLDPDRIVPGEFGGDRGFK